MASDGSQLTEVGQGMRRVTVRYVGHVQGIGFRATVAGFARSFAINGRVCNVDDGSVSLEAEGTENGLNEFLAAIRERMSRKIVSEHSNWADVAERRWSDFRIAQDKAS